MCIYLSGILQGHIGRFYLLPKPLYLFFDRMQTIYIQNDTLVKVENVQSIQCQEEGKRGWSETAGCGYEVSYLPPTNETKQVYYLLDTHNQNAFAHWVFENFIYIDEYFEIKKEYPSCKVVIDEMKDYKLLFLKSKGIQESDIIVSKNFDVYYKTLALQRDDDRVASPNIVFFHPYTSLNNTKVIGNFPMYLNKFIDTDIPEKTIPILYLPRGTKENFAGGDRQYSVQGRLLTLVENMGGTIFYTDTVSSLEEQRRIVKSAKIILLDYGSNFWVNGFFAVNSNIIMLNIGWRQEERYPEFKILYDIISKKNKSLHNLMASYTDFSRTPNVVYHEFDHIYSIIQSCMV